MAVSGRRQTDLGSVAAGSAGDFDHYCEPCLTTGQREEADGFCENCQEYLCSTCLDCHRKAKISRNHKILRKKEFVKLKTTGIESVKECNEHCSVHQNEIIKFYCPSHHELGCNDCMTIGHRTCKIDYIPDKCADIANGKEFDDILQKIDEKVTEAEEISRKVSGCRSVMNNCKKEVITAIKEFRNELNDRLDQMQQDVLKHFEGINSSKNNIVRNILDTCGNMVSDIKCLRSNLHVNKSSHQNGQVFIDMKRAETILKSDELNDAKQKIKQTNMLYTFKPNADLETLLLKEMSFGEIVSCSNDETTDEKKYVDRLIRKEEIDVHTKSDKQTCIITGCAAPNANKLILADYNNRKIKVLSIENKVVDEEKIFSKPPFDVAVMSQDQFAVTIPDVKEIVVMKTKYKLSCVRTIEVLRKPFGIDFNQYCLYVACVNPYGVIVLNKHGDVINDIPLNFLSPDYSPYIAVSKDSKHLYISDYAHDSVVAVSLQGEVTATYEHDNLKEPRGTVVLDNESLLVCSNGNGTIHNVNGDMKLGEVMHQESGNLYSICYSSQNDEIYVGCWGNMLKVLNTK